MGARVVTGGTACVASPSATARVVSVLSLGDSEASMENSMSMPLNPSSASYHEFQD